jgi:FixJ family two-component response regulator
MNDRGCHVIAVVDDDPRILESLQDLLESAGYDASVHASGLSLLASGLARIDLLIADVGLPGMDGLELRERVREARPELPVILISGRRDLTEELPEHDAGYTELFRKPFDGQALLAAVSQALQSRAR